MTDTEALQNQFHDELHTTNLKVIDVSTNLAALSDRVDAISDSNAEVNKNINNFSLILDDHSTRIKDLEDQTKQTAHEVAVRAAKSVTRSIEQSEIQELHEEIHEVALAVDNLDVNLEPRVRNLENDTAELQRQVVALHLEDSSIWDAMEDMDVEHHEELHRLAMAIDNHESRISHIETHWFDYEDEIERLDNKIDASIAEVKGYLDNKMDSSIAEIKEYVDSSITEIKEYVDSSISEIKEYVDSSISGLHDEIDDVSTGLSNVTTIVNNLPPHIVLTKEEYDNLENPDYNSFYFTYEDEE